MGAFKIGDPVRIEGDPSNFYYGQTGTILKILSDGWYGVNLRGGVYIERMEEDLSSHIGQQIKSCRTAIVKNKRVPVKELVGSNIDEFSGLKLEVNDSFIGIDGNVYRVIKNETLVTKDGKREQKIVIVNENFLV